MAIGNLGATLNLLEGYLASEFAPATYNRTQGTGFIVDMVRSIASRADLQYANLRVTKPTLWAGTEFATETTPVGLIAVVAATNASCLEDAAVTIYEATATVGSTRPIVVLNVDAGASTATGKMYSAVFPEPIAMAKLSWAVSDNGADGDIEGANDSASNGTKVLLVYAE